MIDCKSIADGLLQPHSPEVQQQKRSEFRWKGFFDCINECRAEDGKPLLTAEHKIVMAQAVLCGGAGSYTSEQKYNLIIRPMLVAMQHVDTLQGYKFYNKRVPFTYREALEIQRKKKEEV